MRIYADFARVLIQEARGLYVHDSFGVEREQTAYALDSPLIDLCLSLFPWARFRKRSGTPSPILFSLNKSKPEYVCFFISRQTRKMMEEEMVPQLNFRPRHYDWILTPDSDLLSDCYGALIKDLAPLLEKWEVSPEDVCVDYTGGTKTMSAALVLATVEKSCCYSYVGGNERSKGGVGMVLDGKERMRFLDNPWDRIATAERKEAAILFNKARYASAAEVLERCIPKVSRDQRPLLRAMKERVVGYDLWDRFRHNDAGGHPYKSGDVLTAVSVRKKEFKHPVDRLEENLQFLQNLPGGDVRGRTCSANIIMMTLQIL